jgi:hypothetical protein
VNGVEVEEERGVLALEKRRDRVGLFAVAAAVAEEDETDGSPRSKLDQSERWRVRLSPLPNARRRQ